MRLIAIVLGEEVSKVRNSEAMALLDYGFNTKKVTIVKQKGKIVKEIAFDKGDKEKISLAPKTDVGVLENKNNNSHKYSYKIKIDEVKVPIKKGDVLGNITVSEKGKKLSEVDLVSKTNIRKLSFIELYIELIKNTILGIVN